MTIEITAHEAEVLCRLLASVDAHATPTERSQDGFQTLRMIALRLQEAGVDPR